MSHETPGADGVVFDKLIMSESRKQKQMGEIMSLAMQHYKGRDLRQDNESGKVYIQTDQGEKELYLEEGKIWMR